MKGVSGLGAGLLEAVAGAGGSSRQATLSAQQAHFTALDGTVRVKKSNGNSWINADYNVPLEKGDVVQTGAEGMAKIVFNDGTNYTVKQDSLIVIEENSANDQQQTNVAVAVSTGTVDLTTATYVQGSKSQVIVAGATASLAPDARHGAQRSQSRSARDPGEERYRRNQRNGEMSPGGLGEGEFQAQSTPMARRRKSVRPLRLRRPT